MSEEKRTIGLYLDLREGMHLLKKDPNIDIEVLIKELDIEYEFSCNDVALALGFLKHAPQENRGEMKITMNFWNKFIRPRFSRPPSLLLESDLIEFGSRAIDVIKKQNSTIETLEKAIHIQKKRFAKIKYECVEEQF